MLLQWRNLKAEEEDQDGHESSSSKASSRLGSVSCPSSLFTTFLILPRFSTKRAASASLNDRKTIGSQALDTNHSRCSTFGQLRETGKLGVQCSFTWERTCRYTPSLSSFLPSSKHGLQFNTHSATFGSAICLRSSVHHLGWVLSPTGLVNVGCAIFVLPCLASPDLLCRLREPVHTFNTLKHFSLLWVYILVSRIPSPGSATIPKVFTNEESFLDS